MSAVDAEPPSVGGTGTGTLMQNPPNKEEIMVIKAVAFLYYHVIIVVLATRF